jgi:hypothetical protein
MEQNTEDKATLHNKNNADDEPDEIIIQTTTNNKCEVCGIQPRKYKCPGCQQQTCSLQCVLKHKQITGCTGKETAVFEFVAVKDMNDELLYSDVRFLDRAKRAKQSLTTVASITAGSSSSSSGSILHNEKRKQTSKNDRELLKAATRSGVKLILPPQGLMAKTQQGNTFYNRKKQAICWKIDFTNEVGTVITSISNVLETTRFGAVLSSANLEQAVVSPVASSSSLSLSSSSTSSVVNARFYLEQIIPGGVALIPIQDENTLMECFANHEIRGTPRIRMVTSGIVTSDMRSSGSAGAAATTATDVGNDNASSTLL